MNAKPETTLLIVDDEEDIRDLLCSFSSSYFDKVLTAINGVEALKIYRENKVDFILSDLKMPKMDGIGLIKAIREINKETPFVFFSAFGANDDMIQATQYGALDFIHKPHFDEIETILKKYFENAYETNSTEEAKSEYDKILNNDTSTKK